MTEQKHPLQNAEKASASLSGLYTSSGELRRLRRRPTLDGIFRLWYGEMTHVLAQGTLCKISSIFCSGVLSDGRGDLRADSLTPLAAQRIFLEPLLKESRWNAVSDLCSYLSSMLSFAVTVRVLDRNPVEGVRTLPRVRQAIIRASKEVEHRHSFPYQHVDREIRALFDQFQKHENLRCRILMEVGWHLLLRPGELVRLRIADYDRRRHMITARTTKTLEEFPIPLNRVSEGLIKIAIAFLGNSEWIFGSPVQRYGHETHLSTQLLNVALKRNGYEGKLHAHGIRGTFSTWASMRPKEISFIGKEACLQHQVSSRVERAYRHDDHFLSYRRTVMIKWSSYLINITAENSVIFDTEVQKRVPLTDVFLMRENGNSGNVSGEE